MSTGHEGMGLASGVALSKAELRERAVRFCKQWEDATSERSQFQVFWAELIGLFDRKPSQVAVYEKLARKASGDTGRIDLLIPGQLAVEGKSAGKDLDDAMDQLVEYLPNLTAAEHPWLLVVSDFKTFRWHNLDDGTSGEFALHELPDHLELFAWLAGWQQPGVAYETEEDVNLAATELLQLVHDRLADSGYDRHSLREWMTRVLFCLFADDTGVWDRGAFHTSIVLHTRQDGTDLGQHLNLVFQLLNQPEAARQSNLGDDLAQFIYINGDLFAQPLPVPVCDRATREALLQACKFDWSAISPAIFGSMFQNVMDAPERRQLGAHYTTEQNILRTIRPLFLDDLEAALDGATTKPALERYIDRLSSLAFFDPAAGCGNFLVIAYREVRRLETEALRRLHAKRGTGRQLQVDVALQSKVTVDQFHGIEIEEFPAKIARTALYLMDHLANRDLSREFGQHYVRFPIPAAPHIVEGNAVAMDWAEVLAAEDCDYCFGNPPFVGLSWTTPEQRDDKKRVFSRLAHKAGRTGRLDYVTCWYASAFEYGHRSNARFAFVSTNSITQGEQARTMGPLLRSYGFDLDFAHRTFQWTSEAKGTAVVFVVVIGFSPGDRSRRRRVFDYPDLKGDPEERSVGRLNWYLIAAPHVYPSKHSKPLVDYVPTPPTQGSKPVDGGHLLIKDADIDEARNDEVAAKYLLRFEQSTEFLYGKDRWCLWLKDATPSELRSSPFIRQRLAAVREARGESPTKSVQLAAETPALFTQDRQPTGWFLVIPEVSSARRDYIPLAFRHADEVIAGNKLLTLSDSPLWLFGILHSAMWMTWVRVIVGRLKGDFSIAPDLAYCAYPFPNMYSKMQGRIEAAAQDVLDARPVDASLADLYDPDTMPKPLRDAHRRLDNQVDRAYGRHRHTGDETRLPVLLRRYSELVGSDLTLFDDD